MPSIHFLPEIEGWWSDFQNISLTNEAIKTMKTPHCIYNWKIACKVTKVKVLILLKKYKYYCCIMVKLELIYFIFC